MENPFVFSDMVFDSDYTPEGAAIQGTYDVGEKHGVSGTVAGFVLEEVGGSSRDSYLLGAQLRLDSSWTEKISSSFGVAGLAIQSPTALTTAAENNINDGNFRTAGGVLVEGFNPIVVDGAVTYKLDSFPGYKGVFPIKLHGDYLNNPRAQELGESYSVGLKLGKAGKKGLWEIGYAWKEHQNNTWYEEMVDSDTGVFYAVAPAALGAGAGYQSGIGYRGNVISAKYNPYDFMQLSLKLMNMAAINENPVGSGSTINRILLDVIWKF